MDKREPHEVKYVTMMGSAAHNYGNVLAEIQKWVLDKFPDKTFSSEFIELDEEYFVINKNIATRGEQEHGLVWELVLDCNGDILWITVEDDDESFDINDLDKIIKMLYTEGNRFDVHEPYENSRVLVI